MFKLNNLKPAKGSNRNTKRIGRGEGSGQGKQAGKGHKGQKARSGGGIRFGFEGGGMPLYMRVPKFGEFKNFPFKRKIDIIHYDQILNNFKNGDLITFNSLVEKGLIKSPKKTHLIKILSRGDLSSKFKVEEGLLFSSSLESHLSFSK